MKDPAEIAKKMLQKHFPKIGTGRKKCTYYKTDGSTRNTTTGISAPVIISTHENIYIVFDEFTATETKSPVGKEEDSTILTGDKKAIFPSLDLPVEPSVNDLILDPDSITWKVQGVSKDPFSAHYELHVRMVK